MKTQRSINYINAKKTAAQPLPASCRRGVGLSHARAQELTASRSLSVWKWRLNLEN